MGFLLIPPPRAAASPHSIERERLVPLFEVRMLAEIALDRRLIRKYFGAAFAIFVERQIVLGEKRRELGIDVRSHLSHVFL